MNDRDETIRDSILMGAAEADVEHLSRLRDQHPGVYWGLVSEFVAQDTGLDDGGECVCGSF